MTEHEQLLDQFTAAAYTKRIDLFLAALAANRLDEDSAYEMVEMLYEDTAVHNQRARFAELVAALAHHAPELYAADAGAYLAWQIGHALADGRFQSIPSFTQQLAQLAAQFPTELLATAEKLAYFGQLEPLAAMLGDAWPHIQAADFAETAVEEYVVQAMNYLILQYISETPNPDPADPHLLALLESLAEVDPGELRDYVAQLTGQLVHAWQASDFAVPTHAGKAVEIPETTETNLTHLLREFMHAVHAGADIPISRAALAYWPLHEYILSRLAESAGSYRARPKQGARFARKTFGLSPLCPTPISLARFLADMLEDSLPRHYSAAALVALLPAWLRFLQQRGLITTEQQIQAKNGMQELLPELQEFWSDMPTDPGLVASLAAWK